jgi:hypothetical protein
MAYKGYHDIHTPRGSIIVTESGVAKLIWKDGLGPTITRALNKAQFFADSEVYRLCEPYTPLKTSMLVKSGELGTEFGSGFVRWIAPYARPQYYRPNKIGSETGPLRGPRWFERMKADWVDYIVSGVRKFIEQGLHK